MQRQLSLRGEWQQQQQQQQRLTVLCHNVGCRFSYKNLLTCLIDDSVQLT
jgi:hypothetical protein